MTLPLSKICVPQWVQFMGALDAVLDKASAHAAAKKIQPEVLLQSRLFPDMFPLVRQVQIACDFVKGPAARLAGKESPKWEDTEKTFEELKARISRTVHFVHSVPAADLDAGVDREIRFNVGPMAVMMKGQDYALNFALPNVYFHTTTAYNILRHNGVEIGKRDFMGQVPGFHQV